MFHETPVGTHMDSLEDLKDSYENEGRVQKNVLVKIPPPINMGPNAEGLHS